MKSLCLIILTFLSFQLSAQKKIKTVEIKTSAECGMCKDRIEDELNYTKGIVYAELTVESKILKVRYKTKKISLENIRLKLADIGYDADDVKASPEKVAKLPNCCQPGNCKD